jgi:glycosyltransferase involved in cell wall biosynthesis
MAGPAIRSLELARAVAAAGIEVTLAVPAASGGVEMPPGVRRIALDNAGLGAAVGSHACALVGAGILSRFPRLASADIPLAVDLYDPVPLEAAELYREAPRAVASAALAQASANLRLELTRADMILCAGRRQHDLWTGALMTMGRLTPGMYAADPTLEGMVRVVPFGVPPGRPRAGGLRGRVPGIGAADTIAIWGGGIHQWFDAPTAIRATGLLTAGNPGLRLVFMGSTPPNLALAPHGAVSAARAVAAELGLLDGQVVFLDGWMDYADRGAALADANIGVSAHHRTAETRFAWRTRLLDYLWAGLPVACTEGDELGDRIAAAGAGLTTPAGDAEALAHSMRTLAEAGPRREAAIAAARTLAGELSWDRVAAPLVEWARTPVRLGGRGNRVLATAALWRMFATKGWQTARTEGPSAAIGRYRRFRDRD